MPRNERGQFTKADNYISLAGWSGLYKILVIFILIFPWYVISKNKIFDYYIFCFIRRNYNCPKSPECGFRPFEVQIVLANGISNNAARVGCYRNEYNHRVLV